MQRGTKRGVTLVLAVVMAVTLVGCVSLASQPEVPDVDDTNAILPPDPVLPFTEAKDITGSFTEENIDFLKHQQRRACVHSDRNLRICTGQ